MRWSYPVKDHKVLHLTFDDGPIPEVTPWVLETLSKHGVKATFFCVGDNAAKHPEILSRVVADGHAIGNHTHRHLNGWKTTDRTYLRDIVEAEQYIDSKLFRPPYGRIRRTQLKTVQKKYQVIMWSVLTQDYNKSVSNEQCLSYALQAKSGDIVLFHDSIKAQDNLEYALPRFLEHYCALGYEFRVIS